MVKYHPSNPISNIMIRVRANRIAEQLQREFEIKNESKD
jgi:hypothetical protein